MIWLLVTHVTRNICGWHPFPYAFFRWSVRPAEQPRSLALRLPPTSDGRRREWRWSVRVWSVSVSSTRLGVGGILFTDLWSRRRRRIINERQDPSREKWAGALYDLRPRNQPSGPSRDALGAAEAARGDRLPAAAPTGGIGERGAPADEQVGEDKGQPAQVAASPAASTTTAAGRGGAIGPDWCRYQIIAFNGRAGVPLPSLRHSSLTWNSEANSSPGLFFSVAGRPQHPGQLPHDRWDCYSSLFSAVGLQAAQPATSSRSASPFAYTLLFRVHRMRRNFFNTWGKSRLKGKLSSFPLILFLHPKSKEHNLPRRRRSWAWSTVFQFPLARRKDCSWWFGTRVRRQHLVFEQLDSLLTAPSVPKYLSFSFFEKQLWFNIFKILIFMVHN